jgi:hypothetical protein
MFRETKDDKYCPGQIWKYHTRPGEEGSTILILGSEVEIINERPWKTFFHVIINNLNLHTREGAIVNTINRIYFPKEVLETSLTVMIGIQEVVPRYLSLSYREDIRSGEGGYFASTIANAIDFIEEQLKEHPLAWH